MKHPKLIEVCDVILINCYPFWEGTPIEQSIASLERMYKQVKGAAKGKEVIITETGWPSKGNTIKKAVPSKENGLQYFVNVMDWAASNKIKTR